jgi:Kef-type K+ transport system membrane component KefB
LAAIVGAFAAGLVLDPVHFKCFRKPKISEELEECQECLPGEHKEKLLKISKGCDHRHIEELIEPLSHFLVPIFFVVTGMAVDLTTLFDTKILIVALGITVIAIVGKYVSGFVAGKVNKNIVGFGMVPRGEVGLIFASMGMSLGVINNQLYSVIVIMVILTTLLTPPILTYFLSRQK